MKLTSLLESNEKSVAVWPPIPDNAGFDPSRDPVTGEKVPEEQLINGWANSWRLRPEYKDAISKLGPEARKKFEHANESEIVKGGATKHLPFGSYREGYDIVKTDDGKFYMSIMNGPIEIFDGSIAATVEEAEKLGIEEVLAKNPELAKNTGITK